MKRTWKDAAASAFSPRGVSGEPTPAVDRKRERYEAARAIGLRRLASLNLTKPIPLDVAASFLPTLPEWS